jgi:hypothetical protein
MKILAFLETTIENKIPEILCQEFFPDTTGRSSQAHIPAAIHDGSLPTEGAEMEEKWRLNIMRAVRQSVDYPTA